LAFNCSCANARIDATSRSGARKILREIVRCAKVVIVFIQPVGNTAKSSEPLKALNV